MILKNISVNLAGRIWSAIMSIAFIPVYIHFLGIETYGLLGFMLSIQGLVALMDFGLSYTANREFASHRGDAELADVLRTFELLYWMLAAIIGGAIILLAPLVATWVHYSQMSITEAEGSIRIFGIVLTLIWPTALYNGCLTGLERQVRLNVVTAVTSTLRYGGSAVILWRWSASLEAMLIWQAAINFMSTLWLRREVLREMQPQSKGRFSMDVLYRTGRYSLGVSAILVLLTLLTQTDKLILTRLVTLEEFGYYVLAATVTTGLSFLSGPVSSVFFPRLVKSMTSGNDAETSNLYHTGTQLIAIMVIPVAALLAFFPSEILLLWTRDSTLAQRVAPLLTLLSAASALNLLVSLSYSLQAAAGWNRLVFNLHLASVCVMPIILLYIIPYYGTTGAAMAWVALYLAHLVVGPAFMHRRLLKGQYLQWFSRDIVFPASITLAVVAGAHAMIVAPLSSLSIVLWMAAIWLCAAVMQALGSSEIRAIIFRRWSRYA